jgi:hypothetical protein
MNKTEQLQKFIKENKLDFSGYDSDLNSSCTTICGFADFIGVGSVATIIKAIMAECDDVYSESDLKREIKPVFDYAYTYNYGNWWKRAEAKKMYKF